MNWTLQIAFHYPHDRFLVGWEYMAKKQGVQLHNNKAVFIYSNINPRYLNHEKINTQTTRKKFNSTL